MENVVAFNNELSSLYDQKPPISKAKMAAITKSAMRAIKFYKHVVQSVEKFILKCKPEYKVPGLYVIDSIVRQSRHQFGPDKDVFAPRFARNITETFANLFRCAPDDKSRIIRVLNLWQKNNVFAPEVIQPIFDLADPNHPIYQLAPPGAAGGTAGDIPSGAANGLNTSSTSMEINLNASGSSDDKHGGMPDLSLMSHEKAQNVLDNSTLRQLEHMQQYLKRHSAPATTVSSTKSREMRESRDMREIRESRELREMRDSRDSREHRELRETREIRDIREVRDSRELRDSRVDRDAHEYARLIDSGANACIGSSGRNPNSSGNVGASSSILSGVGGGANKLQHAETYAKYSKTTHEVIIEDDDGPENTNSPKHASKIIDNNNLQQLLNDPNVLLQLQTLQNFQKMKQQEEQQYKMNEMRMQEKEFEKHLQTVLKTQAAVHGVTADSNEFNKEVEFVSVEQKIEVYMFFT
uniref:Protein SCAF8 n=1 Tax=Ceratitis capitata TaxID=7213 RepID=W8BYR7_CERCA